jgi:hypothetical protein
MTFLLGCCSFRRHNMHFRKTILQIIFILPAKQFAKPFYFKEQMMPAGSTVMKSGVQK